MQKTSTDYLLRFVLIMKKKNVKYCRETDYFLCFGSSETVNFFLPFALLAAITLRPPTDAILVLNPCLFLLFLFDG